MKVLHIISSLDPRHGGPSEAVRMLIRNRPAGYENQVASLDVAGMPFLENLPFRVYALGDKPGKWSSSRMIPWLREHRGEYDAVILHGLWGFTSIAVLAAIAGHVPYAVFPHGMLDPYFKKRYPLKHLKKWIFWLLFQYWVLKRADRVLFTAPVERDVAPESFALWSWDPMVVSYGADPPEIDADKAHTAFLEHCPQLAGKRFLLYLSRIHKKKGCDMLLEAFATLAANHSGDDSLHLVMAGPDPDNWRPELMQLPGYESIADRVHWPGMLRGDTKWGAFLSSEAFILPSHQENFGIAVAEALSCGCPVLITDKINIAQPVADDGAGLVETDTVDGIQRLLQRWIGLSPEQREAMSRQARRTFLTRYDMKKNARRIFALFDAELRDHHAEDVCRGA